MTSTAYTPHLHIPPSSTPVFHGYIDLLSRLILKPDGTFDWHFSPFLILLLWGLLVPRMALRMLCQKCNDLSFSSLFFGPFGAKDRTDWDYYRPLCDVWSEKECVFCCFLRNVIGSFYGHAYVESHVRKGSLRIVVLYRRALDASHAMYKSSQNGVQCCLDIGEMIPLHLLDQEPSKKFRREIRFALGENNRSWVMPSLFLIGHDESPHSPGRFVDAGKIDWDLVQAWLSACNTHGSESQDIATMETLDGGHLSGLMVIDVQAACIIECPPQAPYLALSYQWGSDQKQKLRKQNKHLFETPGFLCSSEGSPAQTIIDSINVTQQLGHRFLWVDALCIVQDDPTSILKNVDMMDQIYLGADLTIVAAAGVNAYHGLPGVSPGVPRTEQQLRLDINGFTIASMLEQVQGAVSFSRWNTRGWTYQERVLSQRLLYFTESQVSYYCDSGCHFQEQYHFKAERDVLSHRFALWDSSARLDFESRNLWEMYAAAVAEYTQRFITDPKDKLRAMSGVLNHLRKPFQSSFVFGLPATLFDVALLWKPLGPQKRGSKAFPSWSWVGWNGAVVYAPNDSMMNTCVCTISQAEIRLAEESFLLSANFQDENAVPWFSFDNRRWRRHFDEETLEIEYESLDPIATFNGRKLRYPRPFLDDAVPERELRVAHDSYVLTVNAKTAMFRLTNLHSLLADPFTRNNSSCRDGVHELCHLAVLDRKDRIAGTVIVDGQLVPKLANKQHKFIALSRSTLYRNDEDASWDDKCQHFQHWSRQRAMPAFHADSSGKQYSGRLTDVLLAGGDVESNVEFFDKRHFSDQVFWPAVNVLLLSEAEGPDGIVERLGVGRIHIDAFEPIADDDEVLLG